MSESFVIIINFYFSLFHWIILYEAKIFACKRIG